MNALSVSATTRYLLFDNSALNQLFGQSPEIGDVARSAVIDHLARDVRSGALTVLVNLALLGELASLYFSPRDVSHARFTSVARFIYEAGQGKLLGPLDQTGLRLRFAHEVAARGKAPYERLVLIDRRHRWVAEAFRDRKRQALEKLAADARKAKDAFAQGERIRKKETDAELKGRGARWNDVFHNWDADPHAVIDDWTLYDKTKHTSSYCLPRDRNAWPRARELPTLWYARAYHLARLKEIGEGRACDDRGDLYDGMYFQDSAYVDVFITGDDAIIRRAQSARITSPRILRTAEWVTEFNSS